MRRLALLALATCCACGVPKDVATTASPAPSSYPQTSVIYDAQSAGAVGGMVHHSDTRAPLRNALVVLQSSAISSLETATDDYGRYSFEGLPAGTYTVQVLVGQADISKVFTLPADAKFRTNFSIDPEYRFGCRLPVSPDQRIDQSLFSVTNETETRLLQIPKTRFGL